MRVTCDTNNKYPQSHNSKFTRTTAIHSIFSREFRVNVNVIAISIQCQEMNERERERKWSSIGFYRLLVVVVICSAQLCDEQHITDTKSETKQKIKSIIVRVVCVLLNYSFRFELRRESNCISWIYNDMRMRQMLNMISNALLLL